MQDDPEHRRLAFDFLKRQFGDYAPAELSLLARYAGGELEGEGDVSIYGFRLFRQGQDPEECFLAVGETSPNYYPAWGLDPDQMYSVHLGTRFMLVVGVGQSPMESRDGGSSGVEEQVRALLTTFAPGAPVTDFRVAAVFVAEAQRHVVCRMRIGDEGVYVISGDAPPGIYRQTHLPPHVVYRLHLGNLIRNERDVEGDVVL
jgi:hypothetical protein